jgi:hypothetical protein
MKEEGRWKWRVEDAEGNQEQVSLSALRPWKSLRDSHIPTVPAKPWKSGKPKTGFPLSHSTIYCFRSNQKGGPGGGSLCSRLQAHLV